MKKKGFTLAEILIALAVVGIVAAISIPNLVTENNKKVWANSLSVAVSNFEIAMSTYLIYENKSSLTETEAWTKYSTELHLKEAVGSRFVLTKKADTANEYYGEEHYPKSLNIKNQTNALSKAGIEGAAYESKNNCTYFVQVETDEDYAAIVGIDVNGLKIPNRIGRDIFRFYLSKDGYLIPYGKGDFGEDKQTDQNCSTSVTGTVGEHCAARIVSNDFVMDY